MAVPRQKSWSIGGRKRKRKKKPRRRSGGSGKGDKSQLRCKQIPLPAADAAAILVAPRCRPHSPGRVPGALTLPRRVLPFAAHAAGAGCLATASPPVLLALRLAAWWNKSTQEESTRPRDLRRRHPLRPSLRRSNSLLLPAPPPFSLKSMHFWGGVGRGDNHTR